MQNNKAIFSAIPNSLCLIVLSTIFFSSCQLYKKEKNVIADSKLYIPTGSNFQQLLDSIQPLLKDLETFKKSAEKMKLQRIYPGRYTLTKDETNEAIINRLLLGKQDEIQITVGNYASIYELASKLDPLLELTANDIINAVASRPEVKGMDTLKMIYFLAPNTYRFFWTETPTNLVNKIAAPYKKYWSAANKSALDSLKLTEFQAVTLASIVQMESYKVDEQPRVAGLYLNRLKIGMKLDADPTVLFAKKLEQGWDKKFQRVFSNYLDIQSAYNTYRNPGLPPGPICMPNPSAIDAVLHPAKHDYIFFVADTSRPGYHLYAKTLAEQEKNAKAYREWAKRKNLK